MIPKPAQIREFPESAMRDTQRRTAALALTLTLFPPAPILVIRPAMTNRIALGLAAVILAFLALDYALGLGWSVFLGRKFLELIRLIAFWR